MDELQAGDLAEALPPAVMNGRRGGDKVRVVVHWKENDWKVGMMRK